MFKIKYHLENSIEIAKLSYSIIFQYDSLMIDRFRFLQSKRSKNIIISFILITYNYYPSF